MSILDAGILISKIADVLIEHGGILHDLPLAVQRQPVLVHRIVVSAPWTYSVYEPMGTWLRVRA